jgi:ATP-binding cassette subfamily F protein 3
MFSADNITVSFGGFTLLDGISFVVDKKDKIALAGRNGAGKSTLLKIFAGLQEPTGGCVSIPRDATVGYLPQQISILDERTVYEEAALAFEKIIDMETALDRLNAELESYSDYESDDYHRLIDRITMLSEQLEMSGAAGRDAEIEKTLLGLGFLRTDFDRPTGEFSGGWRMRVELAKILLKKPDILLLDEPTNHLDIESIQWLETFLSSQAGAVILVSHDRAFIDRVCRRTIEISLGKIYDYRVNYSKYLELRRERREQQVRAFENQRRMIEDTELFIERFRYKTAKAVQVQSRIKQLEKLERIEIDAEDNSALRLKFQPAPRSGFYPVIAENVGKSYDNHTVFSNANLTVERGEKIAFVGKNGEGKSTFVKCIMGEIPFDGMLKIGHNVKIGYFAQNQADLMDGNMTVFQTVDCVATGDIRTKIRDILGAFMFGGEASDKKVAVLSGGERTRLAMIKLLLEPVNLLILDEPTNHLDMRSKNVLKEALRGFDGTAIIVSHDREFLDGLVTKVYEFASLRVIQHIGGIYEFLDKKKIENISEIEKSKPRRSDPDVIKPVKTEPSLSYEERKERQRIRQRIEREVASLEKQITSLEAEIKKMETVLNTSEGASNVDLLWRHADLQKQVDVLIERWTAASESITGD